MQAGDSVTAVSFAWLDGDSSEQGASLQADGKLH